jgi:hypothetical protein
VVARLAAVFSSLLHFSSLRGLSGEIKAIENYNTFIQLWKVCDPQFLPLLEDARKQVAMMEKM